MMKRAADPTQGRSIPKASGPSRRLNRSWDIVRRTSRLSTVEELKSYGMFQEASAFNLPATATPADIANDYIPWCGISTRTLVT